MSDSQDEALRKNMKVYFLISEKDSEELCDLPIKYTGKMITYFGEKMAIGARIDRVDKKQKT